MSEEFALARDYDEINAILEDLGALVKAPEFHGVICGQLCAGLSQTTDQWWRSTKLYFDIKSEPSATDKPVLFGLYELTQKELNDDQYSFNLVLADDEYDLSDRVQSLAAWCQGFLMGFGMGGKLQDSDIEDDIKATLHDFAEIARVEAAIEPSQEEEANYNELMEYVRVACMMVYGEFGQGDHGGDLGSPTDKEHLH